MFHIKLLNFIYVKIINSFRVFIKMCTFLRSHLESVRRIARETLQKIMLTLGPKYLNILFEVMTPLLSRGYQVHVLVFTVHGVLSCLKEVYEPKDVDVVLLTILNVSIHINIPLYFKFLRHLATRLVNTHFPS